MIKSNLILYSSNLGEATKDFKSNHEPFIDLDFKGQVHLKNTAQVKKIQEKNNLQCNRYGDINTKWGIHLLRYDIDHCYQNIYLLNFKNFLLKPLFKGLSQTALTIFGIFDHPSPIVNHHL